MSAIVHNAKKSRNQAWAWMWLAYSGFLFIGPLMEGTRGRWIGTLVVFATFVCVFALYLRANDKDNNPARFWIIGAVFLLGLATFPWNAGASCLFIYTASFLPFCIASVRRVLALFALEVLIIYAEYLIFHHPGTFYISLPNTIIAIFLVLLIGGGNISFAQQKRADCKLRMANEEIEALAAVAERERIARDLHDVLGHTLSVITLKAELAKRLIDSNTEANIQRAATEIADVERTARTALAEVREAIGGYRSRGLLAEIDHARNTLTAAGVTLHSEAIPADVVDLTAAEETVLALALREAVTNIVRHARAANCRLHITVANGRRKLAVEDDGEHPLTREGNGLRGMRERVEALGGSLSLEHDHGTRLLIDLPLLPNN